MKKRTVHLIIALLVALFSFSQCFGAEVEYSQELYKQLAQHTNAIPHIKIPGYSKTVLKNGLTVYLAEAHDTPIITLQGRVDWGRSLESPDQAGISAFLTDLMQSESRNFDEETMARYKERYGLSFRVNAADDSFDFDGNALSSEREQLISLAAEVLLRPRFDTKSIHQKKLQWQKSLEQEKTMEDGLLNQYFYRNLMKDHPYAFANDLELQLAALKNISPASLEEYYHRAFVPKNTILFVYGDFKLSAMLKTVKKYFGGWPKNELKANPGKVVESPAIYGKILLVNKPDATHAKIKMGYPFFNQAFFDDKLQDKVALEITNRIFGGGMESCLMQEIRVKRGYAYNIDSQILYQPLGGAFIIDTSVKPDTAFETVEAVRRIMYDLKTGKQKIDPTAVFNEINQFNLLLPESLRDDDKLIWENIVNIERKKRDKDYFNRFIQSYNKVTAADAQHAAAQYFYPEKLFTVIVGKKETILPQFEKAGVEVEVVN